MREASSRSKQRERMSATLLSRPGMCSACKANLCSSVREASLCATLAWRGFEEPKDDLWSHPTAELLSERQRAESSGWMIAWEQSIQRVTTMAMNSNRLLRWSLAGGLLLGCFDASMLPGRKPAANCCGSIWSRQASPERTEKPPRPVGQESERRRWLGRRVVRRLSEMPSLEYLSKVGQNSRSEMTAGGKEYRYHGGGLSREWQRLEDVSREWSPEVWEALNFRSMDVLNS